MRGIESPRLPRYAHAMSLEQIRSQIDAIDAQMITLLAQRQPLVLQAAQLKSDTAAVRAADRRAAMMERLGTLADAEGVSRSVVMNVWTAMIDSFIALELEEHARHQEEAASRS